MYSEEELNIGLRSPLALIVICALWQKIILVTKNFNQKSCPLNEWLNYVYNLVEMCNYGEIIRDILFIGSASDKARDSIIRKGDQVTLAQILEILQTEDAMSNTHQTITQLNSNSRMNPTASVHYVVISG